MVVVGGDEEQWQGEQCQWLLCSGWKKGIVVAGAAMILVFRRRLKLPYLASADANLWLSALCVWCCVHVTQASSRPRLRSLTAVLPCWALLSWQHLSTRRACPSSDDLWRREQPCVYSWLLKSLHNDWLPL